MGLSLHSEHAARRPCRRAVMRLLLLALGSWAAAAPAAETVVVDASNSPFYLGGTMLDPRNKPGMIYDLRDGAVVSVTNSQNTQRLWCCLVATNGTATLRRGETSGALDIRTALIASGEGRIQITGYDEISLEVDTTYGAHFGEAYGDFANVSFVTEGGAARTGTLTILCGAVKTLPRDANVAVRWRREVNPKDRGVVIPPGSDWSDLDVFTPPGDDVDVYLSSTNSLKSGCVVRIPPGRTFGLRPGLQSGKGSPYAFSDQQEGSFAFDCPVELAEGATFDVQTLVSVTNAGVVSGAGGVRVSSRRKMTTTDLDVVLAGENTFTGPVEVAAPATHLRLGASVVPPRTYRLTGDAAHLHFRAPADGGPSRCRLSSLYGKWWTAAVHAAAGQTVEVARAENIFSAVPDVADGTAAVDFSPALGPACVCHMGHSHVHVNGASVMGGGTVAIRAGDRFLLPGPDGQAPWDLYVPSVASPWYCVDSAVAVSNAPGARPLRVQGAGALALAPAAGAGAANVQLGPEASLDLTVRDDGWQAAAALWLDPNASTLYTPGELALPSWIASVGSPPSLGYVAYGDKPYIEGLADRRGAGYEYYMAFNDRNYDHVFDAPKPYFEDLANAVCAHLDTRADGLKFINCSTGRLPLHRGGPDSLVVNKGMQECIPDATLVVMVFGSQDGGGEALVGTPAGRFRRTPGAAANPIVNAPLDGRKVWVDGAEVDPVTTGLNGSWQIVSVEVTGLTVDGFGWVSRRTGMKGQRYGEIVVFTNAVSAMTRRLVERDLARRWNVTTYGAGAVTFGATVNGTGRATFASPVPLVASGRFAGTGVVAEGTTIVLPAALPWTEEDVARTSPRAWFDPSVRSTVSTRQDLGATECPDEIRAIWDRRYGYEGRKGHLYLLGMAVRLPGYVASARGIGPEMPWIDYDNLYERAQGEVSTGNNLRFREWTEDRTAIDGGTNLTVDVKTVFLVQDSCRGGSTPLSDGVHEGAVFPRRYPNEISTPMLKKNTANAANAALQDGDVRLNGERVEKPSETGFTGAPEVYSLATTNGTAFPVGFFAFYGDTESYKTQKGAIQGEMLFYDETLAPDVRANVEQYLAAKWTGILPAGKADWRAAVLDGAGRVEAASWAVAPRLAETFSGTLAVDGPEALSATATVKADGTVTGGLSHPQATVALAAGAPAPMLIVTVEGRPLGAFALVDLKALVPAQTWTVQVRTPKGGEVPGARIVQSRGGAGVVLKLTHAPTLLLFR